MRYENEMIAPIKACLASYWEDGLVLEEFGVGYGVADVIAARPSPEGIRHRHLLGQMASLLRRCEVRVIRALSHVEIATFDDLRKMTGISAKRLRYDVLRFLLAENFVVVADEGAFRLAADCQPVAHEIWAVEAKMKNWFEGLCQARRYRHFAHRVYLAIAAAYRDRVADDVLQEFNVGLIVVSSGAAQIVFHPRREAPRSEELFLLSNERIWDRIRAAD